MADSLLRQLEMLRLLPRYPQSITADAMNKRLKDSGFDISLRTVERDLKELSSVLPIVCADSAKPFAWHWAEQARSLDVPILKTADALSFLMLKKFLEQMLPGMFSRELEPQFLAAARALTHRKPVEAWLDKIRFVDPGQPRLAPKEDASSRAAILEALYRDEQLGVEYRKRDAPRARRYVLNPLGLVQRGQVTYLVCTLAGQLDIRTFALHRVTAAEVLPSAVERPEGFNLDAYIDEGHFGFLPGQSVRLELLLERSAGIHLRDTPLAADQHLAELSGGRLLLTATVVDNLQLRWWLLAFGAKAEVVSPLELRDYLKRELRLAAERYGD